MKSSLLVIFLFVAAMTFSQSSTENKRLKQAISSIEKGECVLLLYNERYASNFEKKQSVELDIVSQLNFKSLDSLFLHNQDPKVRLTAFYLLCSKYYPQVNSDHLKALDIDKEINICNVGNSEKVALSKVSNFIYKNSVPRKEKIADAEALSLVQEASELESEGPVDFEKIIEKLNQANSLEPNNPIILDALGEAKFNSKMDVEGALIDFQSAITYSLDRKALEIRFLNRGLSYMSIGDIEAACSDWKLAGEYGLSYLEQYCNQSFDKTIHENPDAALVLKLSLIQDTAFITSPHNSPDMSDCEAKLEIKNVDLPKITVSKSNLNLFLESGDSELYLEAISPNGTKFHFFTESEVAFFGGKTDILIDRKQDYSTTINLTGFHHFPVAGPYRVRVAIRPSKNISGLTKTYYSNWVSLVVAKKYQKNSEDWEFER